MSKRIVYYCGIPIEYSLTRKTVKNLNIRINEQEEILVSARKGLSDEYINSFVEGKAEWIIRNLAKVERYNRSKPDENVYIGKKVYFLGNPYIINITKCLKEKVCIEGNIINIYTSKSEDLKELKNIYLSWLKEQSESVFKEVLDKMYETVKSEKIPYPQIFIRNMKSRWGSCKPSDKKITLNLQLMKTDKMCIEQVVIHELLHFKQANHSKSFYELLEKYMPDWRERKRRLEDKYKDGI